MLQQLFHVHKRTRKIHSPLQKIWHVQWTWWSWLTLDGWTGVKFTRKRNWNRFCWERNFEELPVISVATKVHHFLFTLVSFHKRLLNCSQQASTSTLWNISFDRHSLVKTWIVFYSTREGITCKSAFQVHAKDRKIHSPHIAKCDTMKLNKIKQRPYTGWKVTLITALISDIWFADLCQVAWISCALLISKQYLTTALL